MTDVLLILGRGTLVEWGWPQIAAALVIVAGVILMELFARMDDW